MKMRTSMSNSSYALTYTNLLLQNILRKNFYMTVIEFTVEFSYVNSYNTITKTTFLNRVPAIRDPAVQELDGVKA